jgi:3-hydroxyisobutyrate dehydrogenase-like beta-hydroxyacid dehydrogenase
MPGYAIIGFGEVGGIFARDLHAGGAAAITAYDIAAPARARAAAIEFVRACTTPAGAVQGADIVFVAVTAASVLAAVTSLAGGLAHAPLVVDVNSVSPATKQEAARIVTEAGGRYVEAAVMSGVPPQGLRTPMLLGGPHARDFIAAMAPFDMRLTAFADTVGPASSVKMCRSVMIKGLEALASECMLAARHYGVEDHVLHSLSDTLPHEDWRGLARYLIARSLLHGRRRAEEMREVARTVEEAGLEPLLSRAIAARQDWAFEHGQRMQREEIATLELGRLLDAIARHAQEPGGLP